MDLTRDRPLVLMALGGGGLCLAASYYMGQPMVLVLAAFFFCLSIIVWKWGYWLVPFLSRASGIALAGGGYELPPGQEVLIKKTADGYYATRYLGIELRESAAGKDEAGKGALMETFERALTALRSTVRLSLLVCPLDVEEYCERLEERRSLLEHKRSQLRGRSQEDARSQLGREIESLNTQIRALGGGRRPMQVLAYAAITAFGLTREEALTRCRAQASEAAAVLANALDARISPLAGDEMLRAWDWEKAHPPGREELEEQLF